MGYSLVLFCISPRTAFAGLSFFTGDGCSVSSFLFSLELCLLTALEFTKIFCTSLCGLIFKVKFIFVYRLSSERGGSTTALEVSTA